MEHIAGLEFTGGESLVAMLQPFQYLSRGGSHLRLPNCVKIGPFLRRARKVRGRQPQHA
jgi:hypothetical protein